MSADGDWIRTETEQALIKVSGVPTNTQQPAEATRWKRFVSMLWPWARDRASWATKYGGGLAKEFAEAEVAKRQGEAAKLAAEAAELAAERDAKRQQTVASVNDEIARIFTEPNVPDIAKRLQLANLLAAHPHIAEQLEKIESLYSKLNLTHGVRVEMQPPDTESATDDLV